MPKPQNAGFVTEGGFSLLEIPIGLFIIAVSLVLYASAENFAILNRNASYQELAVRIAVSAMEDLRSTDFASLPASGSLSHPLLSSLPNGALTLANTSINSKLKELKVTANWQEANFQARSVTFSTYVNNTGI